MRKNMLTTLALLSIFLLRCNQIETKKKDFSGEWIINKAVYNNAKIIMSGKTSKVYIEPDGYRGKNHLMFNINDSTVVFPGINTEDLQCKWFVKDKRLIITFDTLAFEGRALASIDNLKIESMLRQDPALKKNYKFKRDSILKSKDINTFKLPLSIYAGTYTIAKVNKVLILTSSTTRFELLSLDDILSGRIDEMLNND
jgi:hypothetical protein